MTDPKRYFVQREEREDDEVGPRWVVYDRESNLSTAFSIRRFAVDECRRLNGAS